MSVLVIVLLVLALIAFALAAGNVPSRINLVAAGLFLFVLTVLLGVIGL